ACLRLPCASRKRRIGTACCRLASSSGSASRARSSTRRISCSSMRPLRRSTRQRRPRSINCSNGGLPTLPSFPSVTARRLRRSTSVGWGLPPKEIPTSRGSRPSRRPSNRKHVRSAMRKGGGRSRPSPLPGQICFAPLLLQAAEGQVSRQLGNETCAAPVRSRRSHTAKGAEVDRGNEGRVKRRPRIAGKSVALRFREVCVGVTQIEREHLPSEAETNVPRVVAGLRNACREDGIAVEGIACAEPLTAELTRHVPAERSERHLFGCRKLDGAREIFAIGAEVQEVRRPIEIHAERPISPGVGDLAVYFVEAGNRFRDVAIWKEGSK